MLESAFLALVRRYLSGRNMTHTAVALESELVATAGQAWPGAADLLADLAGEGREMAAPPETVTEGFRCLAEFVDSSLDRYRPALAKTLYPLFVHVFLDLVERGAANEAAAFLQTFADRFTDAHDADSVEQPLARKREVNDLLAVSLPEHVRENATAMRFLEERTPVAVSPYALDILLHFLQSPDVPRDLLLIVNRRLDVHVVGSDAPDGDGASGKRQREGDAAAGVGGLPALELGLPAENLEDRVAEEHAAAAAELARAAAAANAPTDDAPNASSAAATAKAAKAAAGTLAALGADGANLPRVREARVPMPTIDAASEARRVAAMRHRVSLGGASDAAPDCVFFTITHAGLGGVRRDAVGDTPSAECSEGAGAGAMTAASVHPDGSAVAAAFGDGLVRVWHMNPNEATGSLVPPPADAWNAQRAVPAAAAGGPHGVTLAGANGASYAVDWCAEHGLLLSASRDGCARIWAPGFARDEGDGAPTGACLHTYVQGHRLGHALWDARWHPMSCASFVTASSDRTAALWNAERAAGPVRVLGGRTGHVSDVNCVAFHPNASFIATASDDRSVKLWDVRTGGCVRTFGTAHDDAVTSLCVSPGGGWAVSGDASGNLCVLELAAGRLLRKVRGLHAGPVWTVSCSAGAGGPLIASGGADGHVRILHGARLTTDGGDVMVDAPAGATAPAFAGASVAAPPPAWMLHDWLTKRTPVHFVGWSWSNALFACGPLTL